MQSCWYRSIQTNILWHSPVPVDTVPCLLVVLFHGGALCSFQVENCFRCCAVYIFRHSICCQGKAVALADIATGQAHLLGYKSKTKWSCGLCALGLGTASALGLVTPTSRPNVYFFLLHTHPHTHTHTHTDIHNFSLTSSASPSCTIHQEKSRKVKF